MVSVRSRSVEKIGIVKTRVESFPDEEMFEWSYDAIKQRWREILADQQRAASAAAELEAAKAQNPPASAKPGAPKPVTTARPASTTNK